MSMFDDEKVKNFLFYRFWGTDEEMEKAAPFIFIGFIVIVVLAVLGKIFL